MKKRFRKYKNLYILLLLLAAISFMASFFTEGNWNGLLTNLSATFIGTLFTLLIVDEILTRQKESEYAEVFANAKDELTLLGNMMITYIREPLGLRFPSVKLVDPNKMQEEVTKINRALAKEIDKQLKSQISKMTTDDWKRIIVNIFLIRDKIAHVAPLYKDSIPPSIFGKLLSLKKSFEAFDLSVGILADLLINEPKNWPKNNFGPENNIRIRNNQLNIIEKDMRNVLLKSELLLKELENW